MYYNIFVKDFRAWTRIVLFFGVFFSSESMTRVNDTRFIDLKYFCLDCWFYLNNEAVI